MAGKREWHECLADLAISWNSTPKKIFGTAAESTSATGVGISPHKIFLGTNPKFMWDEHMPDTEDKHTQPEWVTHRVQSLNNLTKKIQLDLVKYKMELLYQARKRYKEQASIKINLEPGYEYTFQWYLPRA